MVLLSAPQLLRLTHEEQQVSCSGCGCRGEVWPACSKGLISGVRSLEHFSLGLEHMLTDPRERDTFEIIKYLILMG